MADEKKIHDDSFDGSPQHEKAEGVPQPAAVKKRGSVFDVDTTGLNAVFENPLAGIDKQQMLRDIDEFCSQWGLRDHVDVIKRGALVARDPSRALEVEGLTEEEKTALRNEKEHKWRHPWMLYWLTVMCSMGAATQGMDESVNNGANPIYPGELGFENKSVVYQGAAVAAPYIACALIGCWLNEPLNRFFGRRGTIFISCFIAAVASIWEGLVNSWGNLFAARFVLGLGIGAKSSTM